MKTYEVRFLQEAFEDLEEIILYTAQDSPAAARRMHDKIIEKANDLTTFPKRGRLVPDRKMSAAGYRMLGIKPYIVFYRVVGDSVLIYRVLHGATNYPLLYDKIQARGGV
ncbi:MAG: type II toxin-antitoxin system RelE/ParE family toxin [Defluviitaleaceae bacterium]|nr:type II toxin-antitoxin system RelE/ParE family toxin [Defluviitaleaceae bacterium]